MPCTTQYCHGTTHVVAGRLCCWGGGIAAEAAGTCQTRQWVTCLFVNSRGLCVCDASRSGAWRCPRRRAGPVLGPGTASARPAQGWCWRASGLDDHAADRWGVCFEIWGHFGHGVVVPVTWLFACCCACHLFTAVPWVLGIIAGRVDLDVDGIGTYAAHPKLSVRGTGVVFDSCQMVLCTRQAHRRTAHAAAHVPLAPGRVTAHQ